MRRRPGLVVLENVVRAITSQPRLAPAPQVIRGAGIPSAAAVGTPQIRAVGTAIEYDQATPVRAIKHGDGSARLSGGGSVRAMGHAARPRTARERFEWPIQCSGTFGGLGGMCGVIITPDDPTLGGAVVGIIGFTVGWTWAWLVQRSE